MTPTGPQRRALDRQRRELAAALAEVDLALPGTISERMRRCGYAGCRCRADPPRLHGPYWQWTRTVDGRTVSCPRTENTVARTVAVADVFPR